MKNKKISALIIGAAILAAGAGTTPANAQIQTPSVSNTTKEYVTAIKVQAVKGHKDLPSKQNIDSNKTFAIQFNTEIDFSTVSGKNVKVTDKTGSTVPVTLKLKEGNNKILLVEAPKDGYKSGENYTLNIYEGIKTKKGKGLGHTVTMKFTVKANDSNSGNVERDSMETVLNAYRGTKRDFTKKQWDYSEFTQPLHTEDSYLEQINNFNKKYKNEKYADITDPNIYTKMPNVNVKFNKVNNLDNVVYFSRIPLHSQWEQKDFYGNVMPKGYDEVIDSYCHFLPMSDIKNNQFLQFIWRVDEEKNMINLINEKRKEKGLNHLETNNDLNAISKWAVKRCYLGYSYTGYTSTDDFTGKEFTDKYNNIDKTVDWGSVWRRWVVGKTPFLFKNNEKIYENPLTDEEYEAFRNANKQNLEDSAKELFGYDKKIRILNQNSRWLSSSKDFVNYWKDKKSIDDVNVENIIYNPKAKSIGVAYLYQAPRRNGDLNGLSGVYLILSE
ncbi:Ig-like domain-containing protein [Clostridium sp. MB40-C1]|uniref:Ig-like domain-containing protein n=1 Tax=Clostridium sp. MB40-C1 TaxID=3070996 RepID=UPI0027DFA391|nr:Ig-like domain-containing protein [Clostridium sp. MB40-C1]WMJ79413.1 Ig-like domain-containing protein [Clostridium sp. MB40-C1]